MRIRIGSLFAIAFALIALQILAVSSAYAQTAGTITFTAATTTGDGKVTPVLTWSTTPAATSCAASGDWTGTKAASGTQTLPDITKSATYNLTCTWGAKNSAVLTWTAPTQNTDGTTLTDLAGFHVYYGDTAVNLNQTATVTGATVKTTTIQPLAAGTWFFAISAFNARNIDSERSAPVSITLAAASGNKSVGITVNPVPNPPTNLTVQ